MAAELAVIGGGEFHRANGGLEALLQQLPELFGQRRQRGEFGGELRAAFRTIEARGVGRKFLHIGADGFVFPQQLLQRGGEFAAAERRTVLLNFTHFTPSRFIFFICT